MGTEEYLVKMLTERQMTVTTVESCTGGLIASAITSVPGSSAVFEQGYVTYCDRAKQELVGVKKKTLERYTAVSAATAEEMALGGARQAGADCCLSVTGYAGPPSGCGEMVGLVYIGCCVGGHVKVREFHFSGDRSEIREQSKNQALLFLKKWLERL